MRTITPTLLAAQKATHRKPFVQVTASNLIGGVVNLRWERLYTGDEGDGPHALTLTGDGSIIRLRITPTEDNRKLYYQRVIDPGPDSEFTEWTYLNQYNVVNCSACALGSEVSLFWIRSDGEIDCIRSLDDGETWQGLEYIGYAPTGAASGLAATYQPNGDLALFFTDGTALYIIKRTGGEWQERVAWDKATGELTGVAAIYEGDFKLLVCGKDDAGNFKVWSLIYGDGSEVSQGVWTELKELASAPADGSYEFGSVFLDNPDQTREGGGIIYRCYYVEKFTGDKAYARPFGSHTLPGTSFAENRWTEPAPFESESPFGLAMSHDEGYAWLSMPSGVWRGNLTGESLDLSQEVLAARLNLKTDGGDLTVELRNKSGKYNNGCQINFSPGFRTSSGNEVSSGLSFSLQAYEHNSSPGQATLILYAEDGWRALANWSARYQIRWNKPDEYADPTSEASVKEILAQILARCGLRLEVVSQSVVSSGFYPDFTIHPGDGGRATVTRLLSFIPDVIFIEGNKAYLVNTLADDPAVYSFGTGHVIEEGKYRTGGWKINRVKVEGEGVAAESFAWTEIQKSGDILEAVEDLNIVSSDRGEERGGAHLRKAEIEAVSGFIRTPVNCGQQLYDVISITDPGAGLSAAKRRVVGISLYYQPFKAEYEQKLFLGGV